MMFELVGFVGGILISRALVLIIDSYLFHGLKMSTNTEPLPLIPTSGV